MKNYFFMGLLLICFQELWAMDDCVASKFLEIQQQTWPLRRQLEAIKKYFVYKKPSLTTEQHEKFKWHQQTISKSLDHVLAQCDHARMDLSGQKFSQLDEYLKKAQVHLNQASTELADYKSAIKIALAIDFDNTAAL